MGGFGRFIESMAGGGIPAVLIADLNMGTYSILNVGDGTETDASGGISFGDGDTGFYETADDVLHLDIAGSSVVTFISSGMAIGGATYDANGYYFTSTSLPFVRAAIASSTVSNINPNRGDNDTGLGWAGADSLSLISGAIEGLRLTELSNGVVPQWDTTATITASVTQTQGQQPLISAVNEISVCANTNDTVTLPSAISGSEITIINNGAETLRIWPASGDDLGAGVDTSTTLSAGGIATYQAFDATTWKLAGADLSAYMPTAGGTFSGIVDFDGQQITLDVDGDSYMVNSVDDKTTWWYGGGVSHEQSRYNFNSPTAGGPSIYWPTSTYEPNFTFQGDPNTGMGRENTDLLYFVAGGYNGLKIKKTSGNGSYILHSVGIGITASVTQTQGQQVLIQTVNEISTCVNTNDVVTLQSNSITTYGATQYVINNGAQTLQIFPASGDDLGAGVNTSTTLVAGAKAMFICLDATNWSQIF